MINIAKNPKLSNLLILILAIITIYLGYSLIKRYYPTLQVYSSPNNKNNVAQNIMFNFPPDNASTDEKNRFFDLINKLAKNDGPISIDAGCIIKPMVFRVKKDNNFDIKNNDSISHSLFIDSENIFNIPASQKITFKASIKSGNGTGNFGYRCDDSINLAGILTVTP